ncbi:MAG: glycosyltransferase [Ginsengibacter sp.]
MKKTIVHVIDSLGRGGAETMLVNLLEDLNNSYNVVLVTLNNLSHFSNDEIICKEKYCLNYYSHKDLPFAVIKLKKIIKLHQPVLVRTDLFWSTIIGRLACPKSVPFIFCIHNTLSHDAFNKNQISLYLEKLTYNRKQTLLSVSKAALDDYDKYVKIKGRNFVLNNFINSDFFLQEYNFNPQSLSKIRLVAVGNLRAAKNYEFLLNAIDIIKNEADVTLDIIGEGGLQNKLQDIVNRKNLPVTFLGKRSNIHEMLSFYNAFVMCSLYEGFGNSPVEAMAIGLPLILNDTEVMREMSKGNAIYFESNDTESLSKIIIDLKNKKEELLALSEKGKIIAKENYTKKKYIAELLNLYDEVTG